ncbi:MAG: hypothetical protein GC159_23990 [Phycisphaera sp.]|nr:hypothetical protein [Phycisphaera sp.]
MRAILLIGLFGFFLYYARKDFIFHGRGRKVSMTEHVLHGGIGFTLAGLFVQAMMGNHGLMLVALAGFALIGGIDEYLFHRDIPGEESDIHAKEHLALLMFIVTTMVLDWMIAHQWRVGDLLAPLGADS